MKIADLKIGTRLSIGFGVICVALVFMVGQSILMLGKVNDGTTEIAKQRLPRIELVNRQMTEVNDIGVALRNMMLNDQAPDRAKQVDKIVNARKNIDGILEQLDRLLQNPRAREVLKTQQELNAKYVKASQELIRLIESGDEAAARAYLSGQLRPVFEPYKEAIREQIKVQMQMSVEKANDAEAIYEQTRTLMLVLGVLAVAATAVLAWWITASITRPVRKALDVANAVAGGDLTTKVEVTSQCEIGQLLAALKSMNENLVSTVSTVRGGTEAILSASGEVAAGNQDLSSRTEQQASSLEETASSMEELTSTVKQNADNARQANTLAEAASGVAAKGGEVIHEVVTTMEQIHDASSKIVDIISVIDGIAFQTNILALNAAVEAARAGEQGRGFAVVAGEVRSLAQRSAAAAKEIKQLIDDSSTKVETGSRLVQEAGSTMGDIVDSVRRVTDILNEITSASQEQTLGIEQINAAITQMDDVTQQNAALVEEAAAASQSMQDQAVRLSEAVAVFKLDRTAAPAPVAAAPAPVLRKPAQLAQPARPALAKRKPAASPAAARKPAPSTVAKHETVDSAWEEF